MDNWYEHKYDTLHDKAEQIAKAYCVNASERDLKMMMMGYAEAMTMWSMRDYIRKRLYE